MKPQPVLNVETTTQLKLPVLIVERCNMMIHHQY